MRLFHRSPTISFGTIGDLLALLMIPMLIGYLSGVISSGSAAAFFAVPGSNFSANFDSSWSAIISMILIAALSGIGSLLWFTRRYSQSISKITEAADQVGTGEQNKRIKVEGPPEMRKLAKAFNSMAVRLEENLAEQTKLQQTLEELAITDDLTGLYNRRELNRLLLQEFRRAKRFRRPLSIIIFDIDHFKQVNDQYGHLLGDQVLAWSSNLIATNTRITNFVARYGGDEFVILLPETNVQNAYHAGERLRILLSESSFTTNQGGSQLIISITISLGIAELTEEIGSTKEFFALADQALYKSKHSGRNQTQIAAVRIKNCD